MTSGIRNGIAVVAVVGTIGLVSGRADAQILRPEGPAEQVGQVVGGALDTAGRAVERGFRGAFARTKGAVESMEVTSRVYSRLLWDKDLMGGRYIIDTRPGGVVILRGSAPSAEASDRAAALAASTVGVSQVFNELIAPEGSPAVGVPGPAVIVPGRPSLEPPLDRPDPRDEDILEPLPVPQPGPLPDPLPPAAEPDSAPSADPAPSPSADPDPVPTPTIRPPLPTPGNLGNSRQ